MTRARYRAKRKAKEVKAGWESNYCHIHDGPTKGRVHKLADGRLCCGECYCNTASFQPAFTIRKVTG